MLREKVAINLLENAEWWGGRTRHVAIGPQSVIELGRRDVDTVAKHVFAPVHGEGHDGNAQLRGLGTREVRGAVGDNGDA